MSNSKSEHESFISGHNGTSFQEIAALTSIPCIGCFARELTTLVLFIFFEHRRPETQSKIQFLYDFILLLVPSIVSVTLWSEHIALVCALLVSGSLIIFFVLMRRDNRDTQHILEKVNLPEQKNFVLWYRSVVNLMTALAILAVDFQIFPRRLAKSETYGFGGMDNGVGFFVIANAIVSPEARGKNSNRPILTQVKYCLSGCIPLLLLGFGRLVSVKGTDYHEHVTEYGVHWNFFFTLAALKIFSTLLYCIISVKMSCIAGVMIAAIHESSLLFGGLSSYILDGPGGNGSREGLLDANREGIFSLPGYLSIYIFGVALGRFIFLKRENLNDWLNAAKKLIGVVFTFTVVLLILHNYVHQVSRRMANSTFVVWIVGNATLMLAECLIAEIAITVLKFKLHCTHSPAYADHSEKLTNAQTDRGVLSRPSLRSRNQQKSSYTDSTAINNDCLSSREDHLKSNTNIYLEDSDKKRDVLKEEGKSSGLLEAVGYNALLFFLLANIMTGIVNMSMNTMYASDACAVVVISIYLFILCYVIVTLKRKNIQTKIW